MVKVALLQKYLSPYRVPLFNQVAGHPNVDLTLIYYGAAEKRRLWSDYNRPGFHEYEPRKLVLNISYEKNFEIPYSLFFDFFKLKPDLIICAPDSGGIAAYVYTSLTSAEYIIWSEATSTTERGVGTLKNSTRRLMYRSARSFIVPGEEAATYLRNYRPETPIFYANNSIEEALFTVTQEDVREKFTQDRLIFTFSGSMIERKGVIQLLRAFGNMLEKSPELRNRCLLRLLGTGPLDLSEYADQNIIFEGFCEGENYKQFLKESHVFVLASHHDCNPLTVIEALFAGNALIVSDAVGNYPEAVGANGLVVPAGEQKPLETALEKMVKTPREELTKMALESLRRAQNFTTPRSANGFMEAIFKGGEAAKAAVQ